MTPLEPPPSTHNSRLGTAAAAAGAIAPTTSRTARLLLLLLLLLLLPPLPLTSSPLGRPVGCRSATGARRSPSGLRTATQNGTPPPLPLPPLPR
jgi:hypothetical protein